MSSPLYSLIDLARLNRRGFLIQTGSLAAAAVWAGRATGAVRAQPKFGANPFTLGVASGDPAADGFVLWTRLAPKPLEGGGMPGEDVAVEWVVADDEALTKVVQRGTETATAQWAHSVHAEVHGLQPDRWYWYQFRCGSETSPKGRARTMPAAEALPERLRFAFASCQHFESGLYTGYAHMLDEDVDLVVHLGDYIYEGAGQLGHVREHVGPKLTTLDHYRNRHAQYKTDADLQAMHAAAPWLVTWDDHEVENNYADRWSENTNVDPDAFLQQRAAAYQAYYEHMPLRRGSLPDGPSMNLYRRIAFGRLAEFSVLDTRQYRTDQPCDDGRKVPCAEVYDPHATILGKEQRGWLEQGLARSDAAWKILAQQVMMGRVDFSEGPEVSHAMEHWVAYDAERRGLLNFLRDREVKNTVVITGDVHTNWANHLSPDFDADDSAVVGAEFVGTSISSSGDGQATPKNHDVVMSENPCVKFFNGDRGYVLCDVSPGEWRTRYRTLPYVSRPGAPLQTPATYVLESGSPILQRG